MNSYYSIHSLSSQSYHNKVGNENTHASLPAKTLNDMKYSLYRNSEWKTPTQRGQSIKL